ncbi:D-alanyl-D-alanine carboxypeptidase/D-alanyl-D-alanine-endopeptidase [Fusobacterium sp.]|uniref:D-alanyl-D-alanine carboxypeptidase/D-alanyl-D-alanine endopeptidase n=1 Tax=Fusobacterium sp. TaxID=68766 RepID=UPI0025C19D77|nr:D-alanyl-D-alanine carboxypeptidase/D-alanyl-D-alanine-endopeptidase [Fusobacterium sp.]
MVKLKCFVLALVLLTGCSNTHIPVNILKNEDVAVEEISTENEVKAPGQILNELESEFYKEDENSEEIKSESIEREKAEPVETVVEEVKNEAVEAKLEKKQEIQEKKITQTKEQQAVESFVNLEMLQYSNIGISIVDLKKEKQVASYNEKRAVTPASIMKVITSSTAIQKLGADTKLETKLLYDGKIDPKGILTGDIYIIGGGDPTLGSDGVKIDRMAFINEWIAKIKSSGIKGVKGDIIVIDNLFGYVGVEEKWLLEDFGTNYGQGVYGISVFDNLYTLTLNSGEKSIKVLDVNPKIPGLKFENRLKISPKGRRDFSVRGLPLENKRVLTGEVPKNSKIVVQSDIPNPGLFLGEYLKSNLNSANIKVSGKVKTARDTSKRAKNPKILAVTKSVPIKEMVRILLKRSDNHYTEHLFQLLKLQDINIEEFWKEKGIDTKVLNMDDGSGLSRGDYVSAELLTGIVTYMYKNYPAYIKLLPRGGYEGTVQDFLDPKKFDGEVRVKSGSMSGIQSYTGYIKKDGKEYIFTIIVNHWNGSRRKLKNEMEKLLIDLF